MEDKKAPSKTELKIVKKNGKEKKEWTVKRILTTVIIAVLALLMVGGSFYYVLSPGFSKKSNAFGFYNKEAVLYENNNVFARTLAADQNYVTAATTGDYEGMWNSWYNAYNAQVIYIALSQIASRDGILAPQSLVDQMIIDSGAFNNEEGEFDKELYNSTSDSDKRYFYNYIKSIYPYQVVINDVYTALTSAQETAFVTEISSNARTFDYFVIGPDSCPDFVAIDYVDSHKEEFKLIDASMISCLTQDLATECYNALNNGMSWEDAVAQYSNDAYAENNGYIGGQMYATSFTTNLTNSDDLSKISSLKAGEFTEPLAGPYAWSIYKVNEDPSYPDLTDAEVISAVKKVIFQRDPDALMTYIEEKVDLASDYVIKDFDVAAAIYGNGLVTVGPVSNNVGDSSLVYGIEDQDSVGALADAIDYYDDFNSTLYNEEVGYIAGPIEVADGYIFARITAESKDEQIGELTEILYSYYTNQFNIYDLQNSILSSDKHENKFSDKFLEMLFGNLTAN